MTYSPTTTTTAETMASLHAAYANLSKYQPRDYSDASHTTDELREIAERIATLRPEGVRVGGHDVAQQLVDELATADTTNAGRDLMAWVASRNKVHARTGDRLTHTNGMTFEWVTEFGSRSFVSAFDGTDTFYAANGQRAVVHYFVDYSA